MLKSDTFKDMVNRSIKLSFKEWDNCIDISELHMDRLVELTAKNLQVNMSAWLTRKINQEEK